MSKWIHNKKVFTIIVSGLIGVIVIGSIILSMSHTKSASESETMEELEKIEEDAEREEKPEEKDVNKDEDVKKEEVKKEENEEDTAKEEMPKKEETVKQEEIEKKTEKTVKKETKKEDQATKKSSSSDTTVKKDNTPKSTSKPKPQPKVTTKTTTSTESIPFKTVNQNDSSLEKGKTKVIKEGKNGVRTITYKETYTDGKLTKKEETGSKVTTNPVDKVVAVGTKAPAPKYLSASQAHSILGGSGMRKAGNEYYLDSPVGTSVKTTVGSNGVRSIYYHPNAYIAYSGGLDVFIEM